MTNVTCETCGGAGTIPCELCNGDCVSAEEICPHCKQPMPCEECKGSGDMQCEDCGGEGYLEPE